MRLAAAAAVLSCLAPAPPARGQSFVPTAGTTAAAAWNVDGNWSTGTFPNAASAAATFPAVTGTLTVPLNVGITAGSVAVTNDAAAVFSLTTGTAGSLTFNNGAAAATFTAAGSSSTTNNVTVSVPVVLASNLTVSATNTGTPAAATSSPLTFTGTITGPGGFTKDGPARMSFTTAAKAYTGPTAFNQGRVRLTASGAMTGTSAVTVAGGAQLALDAGATSSTFTFGAAGTAPVTISGAGSATAADATLPGALRGEGSAAGVTATLANPVVLAGPATVAVDASTRTLQLNGAVSGTAGGALTKAGVGVLVLTQPSTYAGGTTVTAGTVRVSGATATLGAGNVTVAQDTTSAVPSFLDVPAGSGNVIGDTATLSLSGGGASAAAADDGHVALGAGVNEVVGGLVLGGVTQTQFGTYGSSASGATFQFDDYFAGTGVVTLAPVPEPAGVLVAAAAAAGGAGLARRRRRAAYHPA